MIRISRNVHGASSPFKQDSTEYHARTRARKNIIKSNATSNESIRCNVQPRSSMIQNKLRYSQAKSSINTNRTSPHLKETQSNYSKNNHHVPISDSSDHSDTEINLFAGSKSYVTPSPSELPKPPKNWMMNLCVLESMRSINSSNLIMGVEHDSAILVVGTKTEKSLTPLKAKIK